jgi:signal peptidase II
MQAARGTSVAGLETTAPPRRARLRGLFVGVALALYALDVGTKILAVDRLAGRPDVSVLGDVLQLHLTRNPGAAFSTGTEFTIALSCVAVVAVLVVLYLSRRLGSRGWAVALGALLAGVAGNLTDRILRDPGPFRGHVVDFLMLPNWPVFNVADICINLGAALILVQAFRGIRIDGSRERRGEPHHRRPDERSDARSAVPAEPEPAE